MLASASSGTARRWSGRQFHNQPADSHQHGFLAAMWAAVAEQTGGRLQISVHAQNGGISGSDPQALDMVQAGEVEFITLMGGILGRKVPVAEIQGVPFAFKNHAQVYRADAGSLGAYITAECRSAGLHRFQHGLLENGFRQISMVKKPIVSAEDLVGIRMRVPDGEMFRDLFLALEAKPLTFNINQLYHALETGRTDGQENPLVVTEYNKLYEVSRYISMTNHMWSGFNLLGNLQFWSALSSDVQEIVTRNVKEQVAAQRAFTNGKNVDLESTLASRGITFNTPDMTSFRRKLNLAFYQRWRRMFGARAWELLEQEVGSVR
jgi:tripartite ATP-independent transporter DctP family solute receptor